MRSLFTRALFPTAFYTGAFLLLTYPWVQQFSTHYFADDVDGFQNAWNLWWVNQAVTVLHQSPWHTNYLHHPIGISLYAHTLGLFNGLLSIPLLHFLSLAETYNALTMFAFVMSGVTAFWLALSLTRSYVGSLLGGYVFTFSEFHFAHAQVGQLNLLSLEWLPIFVLTFYHLVTRPSARIALAAALSLFAVLLCDDYYFLYAVITAGLLLAWYTYQHRSLAFWLDRSRVVAAACFALVSLVTTVPLLAGFLLAARRNTFVGAHSPLDFSLDLPQLFVPGATSRLSGITPDLWPRLQQPELSAFLGWGTIASLLYVWRKRRTTTLQDFGFWYLMVLVFVVLALGPRLHIVSHVVPVLRLPYALLDRFVPLITLSGSPVRMIVMVTLVGSICVAETCRLWLERPRLSRIALTLALAGVIVAGSLPAALPAAEIPAPGVAEVLRGQHGEEGYLDTTVEPLLELQEMDLHPMAREMYDQTIHGKPIAYGYTSRNTVASLEHDREIQRLASVGDFRTLRCRFTFKWLLSQRVIEQPAVRLLWHSGGGAPSYLYEIDSPCGAGAR